jgi:hypothetical protein
MAGGRYPTDACQVKYNGAVAHFCWTCRNELYFDVKVGVVVGRHDGCPHCGADLKVCKNCRNHDPDVHNQCTEPTAEFIRDRERANFCAHFVFRAGDAPGKTDGAAEAAKAKLEALFKNLK